jgi:two-component system nitrogen regulation response regulator GlnG
MPSLLVVDDEPSVLHVFSKVFRDEGVDLLTAATGGEALGLLATHRPDAVVLDIKLPDCSGLAVFRDIHATDPRIPVILITGTGTSETAIEATSLGAFDYLVKPLDFEEVCSLVQRAFEVRRLSLEPVELGPDLADLPAESDALVGNSPAMHAVYKAIGRVAPQTVTVLVQGESGTGKELVARAIYQHSRRAGAPFLVVNCAAIPETLLESELFGHEKGSFTGADRRRIGKFEQSNGGTLFLDEIGDMPLALQSKILRVLQNQRFERVGGAETIATDVRIIAATNRDLEQMVAEGTFRSDLYYRLNVYTIVLPPLRALQDDLPSLVDYFLAKANRELGKRVRTVAPEVMELLRACQWPGNVRELQGVLKRAVLQATGPVLVADFLPELIRSPRIPGTAEKPEAMITDWEQFVDEGIRAGVDNLYDEAVATAARQVILRVLRALKGNQAHAAKVLGITRTTLRTKMRQLGITLDRQVGQEGEPPL